MTLSKYLYNFKEIK